MHEPPEAQVAYASARHESLQGRGETSDRILSLDQAATRSHIKRQDVLAPTRSTGFSSFKNHGSGEPKLLVAIQVSSTIDCKLTYSTI